MAKFTQVMDSELALIRGQVDNKTKSNLTGLAFSGGGIRSATFNLGVIQSLAHHKLLGKFDYLSTVSGGGYIGSWLSAQIGRNTRTSAVPGKIQNVEAFQNELSAALASGQEQDAVKWLRSYSNYLTPKKGLSGDTLAAVGTWLRNTLLNQITLFMFFASLFLLPHVVNLLASQEMGWITSRLFWLLLSIVLASSAIILCVWQLPKLRFCNNIHCQASPKPKSVRLTLWIIPIAVLAAYSLSMWMYSTSLLANFWMGASEKSSNLNFALFEIVLSELPLILNDQQITSPLLTAIEAYWSPIFISMLWAVIYAIPWLLGMLYTLLRPKFKGCKILPQSGVIKPQQVNMEAVHTPEQATATPFEFAVGAIFSALVSGALGGWLICLLAQLVAAQNLNIRLWWATGFGTPLLLIIFCVTLVLHQGLMARLFRVSQLEWWARLGGHVVLVAMLWAGANTLLIYVPPLLNRLQAELIAAGGIVWGAYSMVGIILGKSANTSGINMHVWKERISNSAPYIFVVGYLVAIAWVVHALTYQLGTKDTPQFLSIMLPEDHVIPRFEVYLSHALEISNHANPSVLGAALAAGCGIFLIFAWRLDVNLFSIHYFYRNRLTRCYLGAGRGKNRMPDRFSGFDPCDDIKLAELKQRPLHLVNTALNLVHGRDLAWQDRKAFSFTFSPVACGFEYPPNANKQGGGYCDTEKYMGGALLGTAMAASGAAASPNMGYHSSPAVAFLLTVFNVRLGHWCPNPDSETCLGSPIKRDSPVMGGEYLLRELFGQTDDKDNFIYLSDGGHFENLGVYELIRRRCRYIMVVDAGQDEHRTFEDVGNLMRKIYIDFGVTININLGALRVEADTSHNCFALGDIQYPPLADGEEGAASGVLLYIKPSLLKALPEDILQYAKANPGFPHQPTADQFFNEAQFESYRHLGQFLMDKLVVQVVEEKTPQGHSWQWE